MRRKVHPPETMLMRVMGVAEILVKWRDDPEDEADEQLASAPRPKVENSESKTQSMDFEVSSNQTKRKRML